MSTLELGKKIVDCCNRAAFLEAVNAHYAKDVVSVEAAEMGPEMPREMSGIDAIRGKNQWFIDNHELHSCKASGPYLHAPDRFAIFFEIDHTAKVGPTAGKRTQGQEVAVYTVRGGKIAREEFYYSMPG